MGISTFRQAKQRLIDIVKLTKTKYGYDSINGYIGINDPLAINLGIEVEERRLQFDFGIYLTAEPGIRPKPVIWLDTSSADQEHINFTYYHEISHHLIRQENEIYEFLNDIAGQNDDFDSLIDRFANIGAAEFLIPSDDIFSIQQNQGFSIQILPQLDECYPASKPAIAIQLAQCAAHRCFVVVCQFGILPTKSESQPELLKSEITGTRRLYVQYSSNSPSQEKYSIGKYSIIPENHLFYTAYESQDYVSGNDHIPFKNGNKNWVVECEALYYKGKVYGVFNLSKPNSPGASQLSLF